MFVPQCNETAERDTRLEINQILVHTKPELDQDHLGTPEVRIPVPRDGDHRLKEQKQPSYNNWSQQTTHLPWKFQQIG